MKKTAINILRVILFVTGMISAMYIFFTWRDVAKFGMSIAYGQLNRMGMRMSYSDVSGEADGFTVNNLMLSGLTEISVSSVTIRPRLAASVLSLSPVCDISFRGASVRLGQRMNLGDGGFLLTLGRNEILLENLRTNGEFSLNGYLTVDRSNMKIGRADARIEVPEAFKSNMGMLRNFLPLTQEGNRWYLRRK